MSERIPHSEIFGILIVMCVTLSSVSGCGTARVTDTTRSAAEELLVTHSIDNAVGCLNLSVLNGYRVFLDTQFLSDVAYRGYLTSALRQHLVASGCRIADDMKSADVVLEARAGSVATARNDSLIGIPQTVLPTNVPGVPSTIPEIALVKRTVQTGVVQVSAFAYRVDTGAGIWQSGAKQDRTKLENRWYFGAGPYQSGDPVVTGPHPHKPPISMWHDKKNSNAYTVELPGSLEWEAILNELPPVPASDDPPQAPEIPHSLPALEPATP